MSELSGSLADFTLSAVIRLLAAGDKTGILVINGSALGGSIFFDAGELAFATTRKHHEIGTSPVDDRRDDSPVIGDTMIADVITRLTRQGSGTFTFQADVHPVHEIITTFSADHILEMVDERLEVWHEVLDSLGSTDEPFTMSTDLDADEPISLTGQEWNLLATLGRGRTATDLATALRQPELETAKIIVRLKDDGLVVAVDWSEVEPAASGLNGGRLYEPDPTDIVVNLTDTVVGSEDHEEEPYEEPASDLAARWRNLRSGQRDELSSTP